MEENNSTSKHHSAADDLVILGVLAGIVIAVLLFFLVVYSMVFGLSAAAIYFGAKLGSNGQIGKKSRAQKVKEFEQAKQHDISELADESNDLRQLIDSDYEGKKMELFREEDRPEPIFKFEAEKAKETVKRVIKAVKGR